ncbi:hypothetical protein [Pseudodesulfovibrio portus]|uniref:ATP-binding protein n=1 Tax=Pseudodesulfovibrio portus TaxID=231439 RepID=A0ABM8AU93_9BACT|nr:hypothetical protein [Pseudodesulfovibrio portus]BDQ34819.1 hypothetical protein JCM14722_23610 [Pseudodesulfovibrio portus]
MPMPFEVDSEMIKSLDAVELVELVRRLLHAEARSNGILLGGIHVPCEINIPDGGEDARIKWGDGPEKTDYLPHRNCVIQIKATIMQPSDCKKEVKVKGGDDILNEAMAEVLNEGHAYIIICNETAVGQKLARRQKAIRDGITECDEDWRKAAALDFYDATKLADWSNLYPTVALWLFELKKRISLGGYQTWAEWADDSGAENYSFEGDDSPRVVRTLKDQNEALAIGEAFQELRDHLASPRQCSRLVGLSGLGKTRLILEAFKADDSLDGRARSEQALYVNYQVVRDEVVRTAMSLRDIGADCVYIVDECPLPVHNALYDLISANKSRMRLVTIDHDAADTANKTLFYKALPASDSVIEAILQQRYPYMGEKDLKRVVKFAEGYPGMAVLFGDYLVDGGAGISELQDDEMVWKIVRQRKGEDAAAEWTLGVLSLFQHIGVDGAGPRKQLDAVAEVFKIDPEIAYRHAAEWTAREVLQRQGDYGQVRPHPIANRLARDVVDRTPTDTFAKFFTKDFPQSLTTGFCRRLAGLGEHGKSLAVAEKLLFDASILGSFEALNSEVGAKSFYYLVEIVPEAASRILEHVFEGLSIDDLFSFKDGRRYMVWALEKLAFRKDYFEPAATMMMKLGAAEVETGIGNNAFNQFKNFYQCYLSGTEAPPEERLLVADSGLGMGDERVRDVCIEALCHGLTSWHFSRMGGAEEQAGQKALVDWQPKTHVELVGHFVGILDRLQPLAVRKDSVGESVRGRVAGQIRGLIRNGVFDPVEQFVVAVCKEVGFWPDCVKAIADWLYYNAEDSDGDLVERVKILHGQLGPDSLESRLEYFVLQKPWGIHDPNVPYDKDGDVLAGEKYAEVMAQSIAEEWKAKELGLGWILERLLYSDAGNVVSFMRKVGELSDSLESDIFEVIKAAEKGGIEHLNDGVLKGLIYANQDMDLHARILDRVFESEVLIAFLPLFSVIKDMTDSDIDRIVASLKKDYDPWAFAYLGMGRSLDTVSRGKVAELLVALSERGSREKWQAIDILSLYLHGEKYIPDELLATAKALTISPELFSEKVDSHDRHYSYERVAIKAALTGRDEGFVVQLVEIIVNTVSGDRIFHHDVDHTFREIIKSLIADYPEQVWGPIQKYVLDDGRRFRMGLEMMLSDYGSRGPLSAKILFDLPHDMLLRWAMEYPEVGPEFLLDIAPILQKDENEKYEWSDFVAKMLDAFPDNNGFLSTLANKCVPSSWSGSIVPHMERAQGVISTCLDHPHPNVRRWAAQEVRLLNRRISRWAKDEAERNMLYS